MDIVENAAAMELNYARESNGSWDLFNFSIRALLCRCSGRSTGWLSLLHVPMLSVNHLLVPAVGDLELLAASGDTSLGWGEGKVCQGEGQLCLTRHT